MKKLFVVLVTLSMGLVINTTYAKFSDENIREGTIKEIINSDNQNIAIVVDNINGHNYMILMSPVLVPNKIYHNIGSTIIFRLMSAASGQVGHIDGTTLLFPAAIDDLDSTRPL